MWWLIILFIFWKPIFWLSMMVYYSVKKVPMEDYETKIKDWFRQLWELVKYDA